MTNGHYRTPAGSRLTVSGEHSGIFTVDFDWVEENCCVDCVPDPVPDNGDLVWHCERCLGGRAKWGPA